MITKERQEAAQRDRIETIRKVYGDNEPEVAAYDAEHPPEAALPSFASGGALEAPVTKSPLQSIAEHMKSKPEPAKTETKAPDTKNLVKP